MKIPHLIAAVASISALACIVEGDPETTGHEDATTSAVAVTPPVEDPDTTHEYDPPHLPPGFCHPDEPPPPLPPENGECEVEIIMLASVVTEGQGVSENGNGYEGAVTVTAGSNAARVPAAGFLQYFKDAAIPHFESIGTWTVEENQQLDVEVCAEFREDDNGGINGADDVGNDCTTVTLTCPEPGDSFSLAADLCMGGDCTKLNGAMAAHFQVLRADADGDGVPNPEDWTPELCDEQTVGQHGRASIIHFHYGDGPLVSFVQNLGTDLTKAMQGYDYVVLLIDPASIGPFHLKASALRQADVVLAPTEDNFLLAMQDVTSRGYSMDIWIHSHGYPSDGSGEFEATGDGPGEITDGNGPDITGTELVARTEPDLIGLARGRIPILMNWSGSCQHSYMNSSWTQLGAVVTSGADEVNFYPNFYGRFADFWNANARYIDALTASDTLPSRTLAQAFIEGQGFFERGCVPGINGVLEQNPCAESFFLDVYGLDELPYDPGVSGTDNMNRSSQRLLQGNGAVRKSSAVMWYP